MYMKSSFKRDAAACPADCCPPAACFLPGAARCPSPAARRPLPAFCCVPPAARRLSSVRQVAPACRFAWRAALSGISGIAAPALFPAPSCCSCLFLLLPAFSCCSRPPPPPGGDAPKKYRRIRCPDAPPIGNMPAAIRGVSRFPSECWAWAPAIARAGRRVRILREGTRSC